MKGHCTKCGAALGEAIVSTKERRQFGHVLKAASEASGISTERIVGRTRSAEVMHVRCAVAVVLDGMGFIQTQTASLLGGRNRSTISNMLTREESGEEVRRYVTRIKRLVGGLA